MPFVVTRTGTPELTYEQVRRLNAPTRGVRGSTGFMDELRAFSLVLPPKTVFSHITAACVQNLRLNAGTSRPYHVTTDSTGKRGKRKGLTWHQRALAEDEMDRWHGLPVTSPLRTWQDLAQSQTLTDLVVVADVLLRRKLCTPEQLRDVHGRGHKHLLLEAALKADGGSASPAGDQISAGSLQARSASSTAQGAHHRRRNLRSAAVTSYGVSGGS